MNSSILTEEQLESYLWSRNLSDFKTIFQNEKESFRKLYKLKDIPYIFDLKHFAELSNFSETQLHFFIHNKKKVYSSFQIPKKNGKIRRIDAPSKPLKAVQRWILRKILIRLNSSKHAHGFIPRRSIVTNAQMHIKKECVMCIDLKDFFPSILLKRVKAYFKSIGYNDQMASDFAELCTFNLRLVQGAPTSPMLANLISFKMDGSLGNFCKKKKITYTRYADDITISGSKIIPAFKPKIYKKITEQGFKINKEKTRVLSQGSCQIIAGVIVNSKLSVGRKKKRLVRAIVHNIVKNGPISENKDNDPFFKERIFGMVSHIINVEPKLGNKLKCQLKSVDWTEYEEKVYTVKKVELEKRSHKRNIRG